MTPLTYMSIPIAFALVLAAIAVIVELYRVRPVSKSVYLKEYIRAKSSNALYRAILLGSVQGTLAVDLHHLTTSAETSYKCYRANKAVTPYLCHKVFIRNNAK